MGRRRFLQLVAGLAAFFTGLFQKVASADIQIFGNYSGTIPSGTTAQIVGNVNLTGDLIVEGTLTGIDTFTLTGNGYQILVQNGGVLDLAGISKTSWVGWGGSVTGWNVGDRLAVAPTAAGVYTPTIVTWQGSWAATTRPANSADVTFSDGVHKPEVANLDRTIKFTGLRRIHFHDGAGVQTLKHLSVVNSGIANTLAEYPIHFHYNGDDSRGSLIEGVVVEGGKNHAFVPHGSHGVTFNDCVAYNTKGVAYWWDKTDGDTANNSDDIIWDDCLSMLSTTSSLAGENTRLAGFWLGSGSGNKCRRSVATCVYGLPGSGARERSGFHWPESPSVETWEFTDCVGHNNGENGIFTWQNTDVEHLVESFTGFRNGYSDVSHGAYSNLYTYRNLKLNSRLAVVQHAKTVLADPLVPLMFEDIETSGTLLVVKHNSDSPAPTFHRNADYDRVVYQEGTNKGSNLIFEDCGLVPADFVLTGSIPSDLADILPSQPIRINTESIIEIFEDDVLVYRWEGGWS